MTVWVALHKTRDTLLAHRSLQAAIFAATLGLSIGLFWYGRTLLDPDAFLAHGHLGVLFVNMTTAATILFPLPGEAINVAAGSLLNPFTVSLVATTGATIGEMTSYAAGFYGRRILLERYAERYAHAERWMTRYGLFAVFLFALVPMLIFDLLGMVAGYTRYNLVRFAAATFAGRFLRCLLLAYAGWTLFDFFPVP